MMKYGTFTLSVYITVSDMHSLFDSPGNAEERFAFFEKHLRVGKVYLEAFRADTTPKPLLDKAKAFFAAKNIAFATGIMPVTRSKNVGGMFCFSDPKTADEFDAVFTYMAENFDEIMVDDSLATNCTCDLCREVKGDADWSDFRRAQLTKFCKEHIIAPAKKANPHVKLTLKYPTWHESFQRLGYDTEHQPPLFDETYSGTETRHTSYSLFRNPRYTSYSLLRYLQSLPPHNNRGAWFDNIQCGGSVDIYLEQAELTLMAAPQEVTLFCFCILENKKEIGALGILLDQLDDSLSKLDAPTGLPVYLPFHSTGEDHVFDFLGMCGVPADPCAVYPEEAPMVLLTAASAKDPALYGKVKAHLEKGGDVCLTAGCLEALQDKSFAEFTGIRVTNRSQLGSEFGGFDTGWSDDVAYYHAAREISLPVMDWMTNEVVFKAMQMRESMPNILLAFCRYANGRIFILNVPDSFSDFLEIPGPVLSYVRKNLSVGLPCWLEGDANIAFFPRKGNSVALRSFMDHGSVAHLHVKGSAGPLVCTLTGRKIPPLYEQNGETVYRLVVKPNALGIYTWQNT